MLRFSANLSLLFNEVDLVQRFSLAKENGFNAVEIQFPFTIPAEILNIALSQNDLELIVINVPADDLMEGGEGLAAVPEKQPLFREAVSQTLKYAETIKPKFINVLPGRCQNPKNINLYLETFQSNLLFAASTFSSVGIQTVFEAINTIDMPNFLIHSSKQMLDIVNEINRPDVFLQYDIYHMHMMGESVNDFIGKHSHHIGHIQFADTPGRNEPGSGQINFFTLFDTIKQSSYEGYVGAEYIPSISTTKTLDWMQKSFNKVYLLPKKI